MHFFYDKNYFWDIFCSNWSDPLFSLNFLQLCVNSDTRLTSPGLAWYSFS